MEDKLAEWRGFKSRTLGIRNLTSLKVVREVLSEGVKGEDVGGSRDEWPAGVRRLLLSVSGAVNLKARSAHAVISAIRTILVASNHSSLPCLRPNVS